MWQLLMALIELGLFIYFYFVTQRWGNMADDAKEKKSEKGDDEGKDNEDPKEPKEKGEEEQASDKGDD